MADELSAIRRELNNLKDIVERLATKTTPSLYEPLSPSFGSQVRGFWPCSSVNESGHVMDLSAQGRTLTNSNGVTFAIANNNVAYAVFTSGSSQSLTRNTETGLDITGHLTMGGWFYSTVSSGLKGLIGKWNGVSVNHRSYLLALQGQLPIALISGNGTTYGYCFGSSITLSRWTYVVARYTPSTEIAVWTNRTKSTSGLSVPASIHTDAAMLKVGESDESPAATYLVGGAALMFLCADALPDVMIENIYTSTRDLFGV